MFNALLCYENITIYPMCENNRHPLSQGSLARVLITHSAMYRPGPAALTRAQKRKKALWESWGAGRTVETSEAIYHCLPEIKLGHVVTPRKFTARHRAPSRTRRLPANNDVPCRCGAGSSFRCHSLCVCGPGVSSPRLQGPQTCTALPAGRSQFLKPYKESDGTVEPRYTNQLGNTFFSTLLPVYEPGTSAFGSPRGRSTRTSF